MIAWWSDTFYCSAPLQSPAKKSAPSIKESFSTKHLDNARRCFSHVVGQKCAVRSRIGHELLFIEGLRQGQGSASRCTRKYGFASRCKLVKVKRASAGQWFSFLSQGKYRQPPTLRRPLSVCLLHQRRRSSRFAASAPGRVRRTW